ncbi:citrate lyase holo-[acyl-carrier protein] synthase [Candidatus Phytoplasma sacchari]|nr:citrate lyase holo-[acyl-carrier protein] synthase [Candidatus Phytoplasma sacchari]KAB8122308.1 citrate lyase holo-[acyl-carrier protein] synthase [Candidatus Phytoplasma sacchari]
MNEKENIVIFKKKNILNSREKRYLEQKKFLKKYRNSMLIISLNIPGLNKKKILYRIFFKKIIYKKILPFLIKSKIDFFYYKNKKIFNDNAGFYSNIILKKIDKKSLINFKKKIIELEKTNSIFILLDMDIIDNNHNLIRRSDLKIAPRKCFLCSKPAKICTFKKKHNLKKILFLINQKIKIFLSKKNF